MGGSLGLALRERRLARHVVGVERDTATLDRALARGAIDTATLDLAEGAAGADLIVLATPIGRILHDIGFLGTLSSLESGVIVTDMGSAKAEIAHAGDSAFPEGCFVPGHPMTGSERSGVEAARADLFEEVHLGDHAHCRDAPRRRLTLDRAGDGAGCACPASHPC